MCTVLASATVALAAAGPAGAATNNQEWQIGFSVSGGGPTGGGEWGWFALYQDGTGDAAITGCGHGQGAFHENVQISKWMIVDGPSGPQFDIVTSTPADAEGILPFAATPGHQSLHLPGLSENVQIALNPTAP